MKIRVSIAALPLVLLISACQSSSESSLRLYVLDGGTLSNPDPSWANLSLEEINGFASFPVPAYLIVHRDGALLWDAGLGDYLAGRPADETQRGPWSQSVSITIGDQLAEIGYSRDDVTYLALSHTHFDHMGNANDFSGSTWLVQQDELDTIDFENAERWGSINQLEYARKLVVNGDHDVFGDGSVILKFTPGHTAGHQSLFINLSDTGPLVLSGDLYHLNAHRRLKRVRETDFEPALTAQSRESLEMFLVESGAELWIQHEPLLWPTLKKAPDYYE